MKTGRPKKYKSKKALADAIESYFRSISRTIELQDLTGATIYNDDGEAIHKLQFVVPPSISALCIHLGIDRSTWQNYCDGELHPEFREVTALTRGRIEAWLEEQLLTREKGVQASSSTCRTTTAGGRSRKWSWAIRPGRASRPRA